MPLFLIEAPSSEYRLTPYDLALEKNMAKAGEIMERYRNILDTLAR